MRAVAYIDLPSGSAIFQILIAGLLGISVAFRSFWRKVWTAITGRRGRDQEPSAANPTEASGSDAAPGDSGANGPVPKDAAPQDDRASGTDRPSRTRGA